MRQDSRDWLEGLRAFAADVNPAGPAVAAWSAAERAILTTHLVSWFDGIGAWTAARRRFAAELGPAADPDPVVVLTTSPVGIAAVEELGRAGGSMAAVLAPRLTCVTEVVYRRWCIRHPDGSFRHHVNHWSWLKMNVPERRHAEFAHHPLAPGEAYWLHRCGTAGAGDADRRDCHLWKWNGRHVALLQSFIREEARLGHGALPCGRGEAAGD